MRMLFKKFDSNEDGQLQGDELFRGLKSLGIKLNTREQESLMKKLDLNQDGEITQEELYRVI